MKKTLLLLFVCLFVGISHAQAQVTVKGTVISSENNEPVIGASVLVKRNNQWNNHRHQWSVHTYKHLTYQQNNYCFFHWNGNPRSNHQAGNENCYDFNNRSDGRSFGSCLWYCKKISFYRICKNDSYRTNN